MDAQFLCRCLHMQPSISCFTRRKNREAPTETWRTAGPHRAEAKEHGGRRLELQRERRENAERDERNLISKVEAIRRSPEVK